MRRSGRLAPFYRVCAADIDRRAHQLDDVHGILEGRHRYAAPRNPPEGSMPFERRWQEAWAARAYCHTLSVVPKSVIGRAQLQSGGGVVLRAAMASVAASLPGSCMK